MKTRSKALLLTLCAVVLVVATVFGTMAYLTSTDKVENTFTVGSVAITLDEQDITNPSGPRTASNAYHLLPGHAYVKDPTVHVAGGSEDSWIFVKVENGIAAFEAASSAKYKTIADQIEANGWTALDGVDGVYYKAYSKAAAATNLVVFDNFQMAENANEVTGWGNISAATTKVTVTAYAVQKDGFDTAKAAWDATFGK